MKGKEESRPKAKSTLPSGHPRCHDQRHEHLEKEIERLRRHIFLQEEVIRSHRDLKREWSDLCRDDKDHLRTTLRFIGRVAEEDQHPRRGEAEEILAAMDPFSLIRSGIL